MPAPKKFYEKYQEAEAYLISEGLNFNATTNRWEIDMRGDGGGTTWAEIIPHHEVGFRIRHGHIG